ncbi:MAG: cupin domain-containing protein [Myxococcales bacterium]|nr:cupin domain-containing protein [Myxococcales bacterium]
MTPEVEALVTRFGLAPHPEGGFFRETWADPREVHAEGFEGPRRASTAIYFLLTSGHFSALHRIKSDEVWHHYAGAPLAVTVLAPDATCTTLVLGPALEGYAPQGVVAAGMWFGAEVLAPGAWALVGCTVAPGFEFRDFELAERGALTRAFPQHAAVIARLTRGEGALPGLRAGGA